MATTRQERAFKKVMLENKPVSVAMREVGYAAEHSSNPHLLTRSNGWKELMEKHGLSDEKAIRIHNKLLDSEREDIQAKALDTYYKVSGKYNNGGITFNEPVMIMINPPKNPVDKPDNTNDST